MVPFTTNRHRPAKRMVRIAGKCRSGAGVYKKRPRPITPLTDPVPGRVPGTVLLKERLHHALARLHCRYESNEYTQHKH
jgi:hypothetical protein